MPYLLQPAESCVSHQDMAYRSCGRAPSVFVQVDPEGVDVPVEIRLEVLRRPPRESPQIALEPRGQVIHYLHSLRADRIVYVSPVRHALEPALPYQNAVSPLEAADEQRPGRYPPGLGLPHPRRAGHPVSKDDHDGALMGVDGDADAQLLAV